MTTDNNTPDYLGHRQRLRNRYFNDYGKSMPDYEILELLLMTAIPRKDVKPLAKELIRKFGSFIDVINAKYEDLIQIKGIKENTIFALKLVQTAMERASYQKLEQDNNPVISNWDVLVNHCRSSIGYSDIEIFKVILLDNRLKFIGEEIMQQGTVNQVAIHPREVIKLAVNKGAVSIVLVHNHPSGDVTPSKADINITKQIKVAAEMLDINLLDHIIVSKNITYSFKDHGII